MRRNRRTRRRRGRLLLLALLILALRLWIDNRTVAVAVCELADAEIPSGFDGFRIAQISDLHGNEALYQPLLRAAAQAQPDLIVITGDLSDREEQWPALAELLAELGKLAPLYYVSGNHEWADLQPEPFFARLADSGVTLLRNRWVTLERGGSRLLLTGVEDPNGYADMPTPEELAQQMGRDAEPELFRILLSHRPDRFPLYAELGFDLTLSGHNHGGLLRLPLLGGVFSPGGLWPRYDAGLFTLSGSRMYVSRGLCGSVGLPRFLNRPELPLLILRSSDV